MILIQNGVHGTAIEDKLLRTRQIIDAYQSFQVA